jgi:hypothetical protein
MAESPDRNKDQKLDEMLDGLLCEYSSAEPRPGLETRILAQVREASKLRGGWSPRWMWIGAAVAAAVIVLAIYWSRPAEQPRAPEITRQPVTSPKAQPSPAPRISASTTTEIAGAKKDGHQLRVVHQRAGHSHVANLRREVFPSPSPLSEQERLLLRYLAITPREELVAQSRPDEAPPEDAEPDQSALPGASSTNQKLTNTR